MLWNITRTEGRMLQEVMLWNITRMEGHKVMKYHPYWRHNTTGNSVMKYVLYHPYWSQIIVFQTEPALELDILLKLMARKLFHKEKEKVQPCNWLQLRQRFCPQLLWRGWFNIAGEKKIGFTSNYILEKKSDVKREGNKWKL